MNERIKELLNQATIDALFETKDAVDYLDNPVTKQQRQLQLEKFAELIVRECIGVVENLSPGYKDYRDQIEDAFRRDCIEEMRAKFGVEE